MLVGVGMHHSRGVTMTMGVDQVGALQKIAIAKNIGRRALGHQAAGIENAAAVGDVFQIGQIVRGDDHRFRSAAPFHQKIDDLALAARVERGGRLVEQQHGGIENQHTGQSDALLLAAGKTVGYAVPEMGDAQAVENPGDALADVGLRPAELQWAKGHLVEYGGVEELHVGILEHEADFTAKATGESVFGEARFSQLAPAKSDAAGLRKTQAVQKAQKRGLAGAVRAKQGDPASPRNGKAEIVQCDNAFVAKRHAIDIEEHQRPAHTATATSAAKAASAAQSRGVIRKSSST